MSRTTQFIIGILAIGLAIGAGFYGRNAYLKEISTYLVPVPKAAIPAYTILKADMFQMVEMPRTFQNLPYYQTVEDLTGLISTESLPLGLPVVKDGAVAVQSFRMAAADYEVLSIPVEPVSSVGGQIHIGERVNLYRVVSIRKAEEVSSLTQANSETEFQTSLIAGNVQVVDVRTQQGVQAGPGEETTKGSASLSGSQQVEQVQILTLAVKPEWVEPILNAVAQSKKQGGLLWTSLAIP